MKLFAAGRPEADRRGRGGARGRAARAASRHAGRRRARTGDAVGTVDRRRRPRSAAGPSRCVALDRRPRARRAAGGGRLRQRRGRRRWRPRCCARSAPTVEVLHDEPDGTNINAGCGSTYPEDLQRAVVERGADVGLAFDGDADRVLAVDADGRLDRRRPDHRHHAPSTAATAGGSPSDTVVVTVMTNLGFRLGMRRARHRGARGARSATATCSRRWPTRASRSAASRAGTSIFADLATTGDGLLTAVQLLDVVQRSGRRSAELADAAMTRLPQVLRNVRVAAKGMDLTGALADEIAAVEAELGDHGRVLVRASGTEPLVRVMVEAPTAEQAEAAAGPARRPPSRPSGPPEPAGTLSVPTGGHRRVRHHRPRPRARRPDAPHPADVLDRLSAVQRCARRAPDPVGAGARPPRAARGARRAAPQATDGVALLVRDREVAARDRRGRRGRRRLDRRDRGRASTPTAPRRAASLEDANAALAPPEGRAAGRWCATGSPPPHGVRELVGRRPVVVGHRGRHVDPAGAVGPRPPRGARPRLGRPHRPRARPRPRPRRSRRRPADRRARRRPPLPLERGAHARGPPQLRLQGGRRDRRARRQHRGHARRPAGRRPAAAGAAPATGAAALVLGHTRWASIGIISQPNAHPVDSLEVDGDAGPVRHRRPQRRRRQLRRPQGRRRPAPGGRDHHRRQGDPHARVPPPGRGRRPHHRLPRHRRQLRGVGRHRRQRRRRTPTTCCSPCGAAARRSTSAWPTTASSSPPSPTGWWSSPSRYLRLDGDTPANPENPNASRGQIVVLDGAPGRHARRHRRGRPTTAPPLPGRPTTSCRRRRSPPATSTVATTPTSSSRRSPRRPTSFRKTLRGKLVERDGALHVLARRRRARRQPCASALRDGRIDRVQVIGQGTAHVAGQSLAGALLGLHPRRPPARRGAAGHRAVRASGSGPT